MEKLSIDKFSDKKIEDLRTVHGGKMACGNTTWKGSDGTSGGDDWDPETDCIIFDDGYNTCD